MAGLSTARRRRIKSFSGELLPDEKSIVSKLIFRGESAYWDPMKTLRKFSDNVKKEESDSTKKCQKHVSNIENIFGSYNGSVIYLFWCGSILLFYFLATKVTDTNDSRTQRTHASILQRSTEYSHNAWTRSHILSYYDSHTATRITRCIQIAIPQILRPHPIPKWKSIEQEPWFDFQDPDDGVAFSLQDDDSNNQQCFPMAEWQTSNYQNCNQFHELETHSSHSLLMQYINCGENRCTFLSHHGQDTLVLKTLKLGQVSNVNDSFFGGPSRYRMAIKDSLALSKLTSSPFVVNIYGSCALAQLVEHSSGGNIHDLLKRSRLYRNFHVGPSIVKDDKSRSNKDDPSFHLISPLNRLKIAYHVATAVADMHALEEHPYNLPSMSHNDLCCHQFMLVDGVYKLGDFDWATILTQTKPFDSIAKSRQLRAQNEAPGMCQTTPLRMSEDNLKSLAPEELLYYEEVMNEAVEDQGWNGKLLPPIPVYRDKLDVYQIGTIMYYLATNRWVWEGLSTYEVMLAVIHGKRSPFRKDEAETWETEQDNSAYQILRQAILMAWSHNPSDRPSARALSLYLYTQMQPFLSDPKDYVLKVEIPPLPPHHSYTDSDFNRNWEDMP